MAITKAIIKMAIIKAVEYTSDEVHAFVCGSKLSLLNQLGISNAQTFFQNPADDTRDVHVFLNAPHLLKLTRNRFLDHGFDSLDRKQQISSAPIIELLAVDSGELELRHKLSDQHINLKGSQRQQVRYAMELMSGSVANALQFLGKNGKLVSKDWRETA